MRSSKVMVSDDYSHLDFPGTTPDTPKGVA